MKVGGQQMTLMADPGAEHSMVTLPVAPSVEGLQLSSEPLGHRPSSSTSAWPTNVRLEAQSPTCFPTCPSAQFPSSAETYSLSSEPKQLLNRLDAPGSNQTKAKRSQGSSPWQ